MPQAWKLAQEHKDEEMNKKGKKGKKKEDEQETAKAKEKEQQQKQEEKRKGSKSSRAESPAESVIETTPSVEENTGLQPAEESFDVKLLSDHHQHHQDCT